MSKKKEQYIPLNRWRYFTKTLYHNASAAAEFTYDNVIYVKDEELQNAEQRSQRLNYVMLFGLILMYLLSSRFQTAWIIVGYMILVLALQPIRVFLLPKDIHAHLIDSGRRERHG